MTKPITSDHLTPELYARTVMGIEEIPEWIDIGELIDPTATAPDNIAGIADLAREGCKAGGMNSALYYEQTRDMCLEHSAAMLDYLSEHTPFYEVTLFADASPYQVREAGTDRGANRVGSLDGLFNEIVWKAIDTWARRTIVIVRDHIDSIKNVLK